MPYLSPELLNTPPADQAVNWLLLDLNSFFASCEQQYNPSLRGRPVGIVPMMGVETTCLLAASYEAKKFGLKTGMAIYEAKSRCPDLILLPACHKKYVLYHEQIVRAIDLCTPVDRILSIDEMGCRMTGSQRHPDQAIALAEKIKKTIHDTVGVCLTSSIGIAPNLLLAKLASDMHKPNGLVVITPADIPHKFLHLPISDFSGIGPRMKQRLNSRAIYTMQDLYRCDKNLLRTIWGGIEGERFYAKMHGQDIDREQGNKTVIGHQHVLEPQLRNTKGALDVLHYLTLKAGERLRSYGYLCKQLDISIKFENRSGKWKKELRFSETQDSHLLLHTLQTLYSNFLKEYRHEKILRVGVALQGLVQESAHQGDLFTTHQEDQNSKALLQAIDQLNTKFGRHSVTYGVNCYVQRKVGTDKIAFQRVPEINTL